MLNRKEDFRPTKFTCYPHISSLDPLTALWSDFCPADFLFPNPQKNFDFPGAIG